MRSLLLSAALLLPLSVHAQLWGYVDAQGVAHVSRHQVDGRYSLVLGARNDVVGRVPGKTDGSQDLLTWLEFAPEVKAVQPWLRESARRHGVDMELLKAVIAVESGFKRDAISPRGAVGLMQIMAPEDRARRLLEPRHNIDTGAQMLAGLIKKFGRIDAALAAWNAGEGTVRRNGGRMPDIAETQAHVHLVLELYWALLQRSLPSTAQALRIHSSPE
ncbi:lytic transglycosylase domain-containing protein [Pelomonas sp. SE-A7]|uniref:lytic transglycosylase domain-containing protein n=1 Tax=Pelomonas sp. SE-A7 TaxID=3054953 RepID=UPI00259CCA07|nr:lytic transglycosylase domain-containing protein [Pelomonas sp. SE-A7]MDM4765498.1 lytic transglycosylase domain-containing protein [Pelomonas sp. SE-A7]